MITIACIVLFIGIIYAIYRCASRPRRLWFNPTHTFNSRESILPLEFKTAWACVEETMAKPVSHHQPATCRICGKDVTGRYPQNYRFGRYIWSGLERQHMMYAHVTYGDDHGYYLPDPGFVSAVMDAYRATAPVEYY